MSSRRGGQAKGPPKHQNMTTWKPNRNVTKNEKDLGSKSNPYPPITGVCERCRDQIAWRRKYGKYKQLTEPAKCVKCSRRNVRHSYHAACSACAQERGICPKCLQPGLKLVGSELAKEQEERRILEESLGGLRERERRTLLRAMMASNAKAPKAVKLPAEGGGEELRSAAEEDEEEEEWEEEEGVDGSVVSDSDDSEVEEGRSSEGGDERGRVALQGGV